MKKEHLAKLLVLLVCLALAGKFLLAFGRA